MNMMCKTLYKLQLLSKIASHRIRLWPKYKLSEH